MNSAAELAIPEERIFIVRKGGGIEGKEIRPGASSSSGDGWCHVHKRFTVDDISRVRGLDPGIRVIVHPECDREVVAAADASGSTEAIRKAIEDSPAGTRWAVGTEASFLSAAWPPSSPTRA